MKYLNKIAISFCSIAFGLMAMTSCEGGDLFDVNSPEWLQERIDSIAANKTSDFEIPDVHEDVYTIGATDFSTGWWAQFSKYYVIPEGKQWNLVFNLNINPNASNTYKNFALIICNDADRGSNKEYGAIRYDYQPSGNSEWGDYIDRSCASSNLEFQTDTDEGVQKLGGKVVLTIDRTDPNVFTVTMDNGTIKKTYIQKSPLVNLNDDEANTNIRAFLVPEGSYIDVIGSDIEPIGGYTSALDKEPLSMTLNQVPKKVMVGTEFADAFANVSATVNFEQGVSQTIPMDQVDFTSVDLSTTGKKSVTAIYYSTFKGEKAAHAVSTTVTFDVVDKMYDMLGSGDNSTGWWGAHSENVKVNPKETVVQSFYNYTSGISNWNNFVVVLCRADNSEYAVVRADNYGWGDGYGTCTPVGTQGDWATWLAAMDGAKVTTYVTNNGDGTADVKAVMLGNNGETYEQSYTGISVNDPNDFYYRYTVDGCHLEWADVLGADDNTTGWWGAHSENIQIPAGYTVTRQFLNYTSGASNWDNWVAVLCRADNSEYAVVRADNYGWGDGYAACAPSGGQADWGAWLKAMDEAKVTVSVTNNGDGTGDVKSVMVGNDGQTYIQNYVGINTIDPADFYYRFTVDGCHLVFEPSARDASGASAKRTARRPVVGPRK